MAHHNQPKEIDVKKVVRHLSRAFSRAADQAAPAIGHKALRTIDGTVDPTPLYLYQVEFCYLIDNIERGPSYIAPKFIQEANELIDKLVAESK